MPQRRPAPRLRSVPRFLDPSRLSFFKITAVTGLSGAAIIASARPSVNRHLDAARRDADNVSATARTKRKRDAAKLANLCGGRHRPAGLGGRRAGAAEERDRRLPPARHSLYADPHHRKAE